MSGPNFSSKASVTFSNSAGRRQKMKCLKASKIEKIALFDRKIACFEIFAPVTVNILMQLKYITKGMTRITSDFRSPLPKFLGLEV